MAIPLDQLRAQRELVKRHLDWLDARIIEASGADAAAPAPVVPASESAPVAAVSAGEAAAVAALPAEALLEVHAPEEFGISQGAKYGCMAIAAFIVLGFLFVLFVLPRFLYGDKKSGEPVEPSGVEQPVSTPTR